MEGHYRAVSPFDSSSRKDILRMIGTKIQRLRCNIHVLVVNVNSLIDARHNHGLNTGDTAEYVRKMCALVGYFLHKNAPIIEFNLEDHLTKVCPDLSKAERNEARVFYSLVFQLMKTQSLLFYGRYIAYARYIASALKRSRCYSVKELVVSR